MLPPAVVDPPTTSARASVTPVAMPSVMVVEDELVIRLILRTMLEEAGYQVMDAQDGMEAVDLYAREAPDLILMDMVMPRMSGAEAAKRIKDQAGDRFVPILFLTAIEDTNRLATLLDDGGDDFLVKPVDPVILKSKLNALDRTRRLYALVREQKEDLLVHRAREWHEREIAAGIMSRVTRMDELAAPNLQYHLAPAALLNGDLLLAAHTPAGAQRIFLGDFTGHGLPASIGAMPVSEIFYTCTDRGVGMVETIREINSRMLGLLPDDVFLSAACVELDIRQRSAMVWNAGLPDLLWVRKGGLVKRFRSSHLPLGIVEGGELDEGVHEIPVQEGDRFFLYTDGMMELRNNTGEEFGYDRLESALFDDPQEGAVERLLTRRKRFIGDIEPTDDATLIEVACVASGAQWTSSSNEEEWQGATQWSASFSYDGGLLRTSDPLPALSQLLTDFHMPLAPRRDAMMIIRELFTNSLDHGVLGLTSELKQGINGFAVYAQERQGRLAKLREGSVTLRLTYSGSSDGGKFSVTVSDSGDGYAWQATDLEQSENSQSWGRGLALVRSVCSSIVRNEAGNLVEVQYDW